MKLSIALLVALLAVNAQAAVKKHSIKMVTAGSVNALDAGDSYGTALAVGRMSPITMQVELVGMLMPDPNSTTTPKRNVKGVLDISSELPGDPVADAEASERLDFFFSTKVGKGHDDDGNEFPVPKVVTVVYSPDDVLAGTTNCMGLDLEIPNQTTPTTKECYIVRPLTIIQHTP
jgi:hypothetical protein